MDEAYINRSVFKNYLEVLSEKTTSAWKNRFITTNWGFLLQREILGLSLTDLPDWMANSHVYHLNGTVEEPDV